MNSNIKGIIVKISAIILYILLIVFLYNVGKGHTVYIFNQKFITSNGTEIEALYTCKIINPVSKSAFVDFANLVSSKILVKKLYQDQVFTFHKGVPGQIVIPWHKKKVVFEFYDGKNLVKRMEKEVVLDPKITQYIWQLAALYVENNEWSGEYIIQETTDSEIIKDTEVTTE
ncbi:MAG: hypothetical protein GYA61_05825 [Spirochaetales bacterium]|nr:hypothetical protein [Spirochaetales bacterium]